MASIDHVPRLFKQIFLNINRQDRWSDTQSPTMCIQHALSRSWGLELDCCGKWDSYTEDLYPGFIIFFHKITATMT